MSFDRLVRAAELFSDKAAEVCSSDFPLLHDEFQIVDF